MNKRAEATFAPRGVTSVIAALAVCLVTACTAPDERAGDESSAAAASWFEDRTAAAGVDRPHHNRSFKNPYAEIMQGYTALGASAAVADYNGDGFEDVFFTVSSEDGANLLYRNDGDFTFTEVAAEAGVAAGNDAANASANSLWLDYDNDGDPDLLVVRFGQNLLYRNNGAGADRGDGPGRVTFTDVTEAAGLGPRYLNCIVAIAFDYDLDGDLDLFYGNYFQPVNLFDPQTSRFFPESFETAANGGGATVYRNNGDGTFTDVTEEAGVVLSGWTLDLGHADADHDGDDDLYVAADFGTDSFFRNNGDGTFTDVSGQAIGIDTKKGMNVDWADFDSDGLFDVFVTNITDEYMKEGNFLWQNLGGLTFADVSRETGTHATGWGWAGKFFDYDNDSWPDLYVVNGWVSGSKDPEDNYVRDIFEVIRDPEVDLADARNWPPMGDKTLSGYQKNALFRNQGGTFVDEAARHGVDSELDARGVAVADFDHDGRLDLFVTNAGKPPLLWRNGAPRDNHWVRFRFTGREANRDAVGTRAWVQAGGRTRVSFVNGGNGFASQSTRQVHFGLADAAAVDRLVVIWPSGLEQEFADLPADRVYQLTEGEELVYPCEVAAAPPALVANGDGLRQIGSAEGVTAPPADVVAGFAVADTPAAADVAASPVGRLTPAESGGPAFATYREGMAALAAGNYETAFDKLEQAIAAEPDNLRYGTDYRQGVIRAGDDNPGVYKRSIAFFEKLVKEHPEAANAWLNLGFAHVDKIPVEGAITQVLLANMALEHFDHALALEETWLGLYSRGHALLFWPPIFGRADDGVRLLERAVEISRDNDEKPYHARAWAALGDGHWRLGDVDRSREIWREGLELFPGDPELEARLARTEENDLDAYLDAHYDTSRRVETHLREIFYAGRAIRPSRGVASGTVAAGAAASSGLAFAEVGERAGVRFVHSTRDFTGRHKHQVLEMFTDGGAAVAVGDYNGDGFEDLYVTDSDAGKPNHLMRNDGPGRGGVPTFTEVTAAAGVGGGNDPLSIVADAVWLDYDNDGHLDLYLGRFGTPILYRNLGPAQDDRFEDVSERVGLTVFGNTIGTIAFDADNDGWLDLMLANYFQPLNLLDLETTKVLPNNLDYADNGGGVTFYHNVELPSGERGFVDATAAAGLAHHTGWSLDIGHADLDNDGWQDVYVAGDYGTDRLFMNNGAINNGKAGGTPSFRDVTEEAIGFDTRKGMNVDMGDYNRDGWLDVYVTNITDEYMKECNMLWHNMGDGADGTVTFMDLSKETGTCDTDWGWAAKFADFDNDGWEDLFVVNGLRSRDQEANYIPVLLDTTILKPGVDFSDLDSYPDIGDMTWSGYQKQRLFYNLGDGTFKEVAAEAGVDNDLDGRGIGVGDFDNDGLLDFFQSNANQPSLFYLGRSADPGRWVELELVGKTVNRNAIGARVVVTAGGETWLREVNGGNGYSSQSTYRLHFGLGRAAAVDSVEVRWPGGPVETLNNVPINAISVIEEGKGVISR